MKIIVTGGAGFIGSQVADQFIEDGHEVIIIDDLSTGFRENLNPKAKFYEVDIRDYKKVAEIIAKEKPEVIDHHAAQMDVRRSTREPIFDAECNILASVNLIDAAVKNKVRKIIYANTGGALYGEAPAEDLPLAEEYPINPICQYGASKHAVEHYLYLYGHNYGIKYTTLRYPNVYGPRQNPHGEAGVIAIFTAKMLKGERPTIFGDGSQTRDYTFVQDIVSANVLALTKGDNQPFNIGTNAEISVQQIFDTLKEILDFKGEPIYSEPRLGEIQRFSIDAEKATKILGWEAKYGFEEGIRKTVAYYRGRITGHK